MRVALVGGGAIGLQLLQRTRTDSTPRITALVVRRPEDVRAQVLALAPDVAVLDAVPHDVDLVLEAAGHAALQQHVLPALARGVPAIVVSVGALAAPGLAERLEAAARAGGTRLHLVAGAIGAIDALAAARLGGLDRVHYTGRKPPLAWRGTPAEQQHDLTALHQATVVFEGTAREAALRYPRNANVAATVALAGLGLEHTQVQLVADPAAPGNVHEIEASGSFGALQVRMHNAPLAANPRTSALTVYSALRALRAQVDALLI